MSRLLVEVKEMSPKDGYGRIELTYADTRRVMVQARTSTGIHEHEGIEGFTETEIVRYRGAEEREQLLRIYTPVLTF